MLFRELCEALFPCLIWCFRRGSLCSRKAVFAVSGRRATRKSSETLSRAREMARRLAVDVFSSERSSCFYGTTSAARLRDDKGQRKTRRGGKHFLLRRQSKRSARLCSAKHLVLDAFLPNNATRYDANSLGIAFVTLRPRTLQPQGLGDLHPRRAHSKTTDCT